MGEIKSAREIAQDKADKLGVLSPAEKRRQQEEKYGNIGRALADRYLERENKNYLLTETQKYNSPDRQMVIHAIIKRLAELIDIKHNQNSRKINEGIRAISESQAIDIMNQIDELLNEYHHIEAEERQRIDKAGKEILHGMRISGTAIGSINTRANAEWQQRLEQICLPYEERLNNLKIALLSFLEQDRNSDTSS